MSLMTALHSPASPTPCDHQFGERLCVVFVDVIVCRNRSTPRTCYPLPACMEYAHASHTRAVAYRHQHFLKRSTAAPLTLQA